MAIGLSPHQPHPLPTSGAAAKTGSAVGADDRAGIRRAAQAFEAMFVAEMLQQAGLGKVPDGFGGGEGESAFSSFLSRAYAEKIAETGSLGLAEAIVRAAAGENPHG
tara:strand:+ start:480 stop:800 length:321 start_codon:yes stop_codon:yes gene_type:complete